MKTFRAVCLLIFWLPVAKIASALTVLPRDFDQLVARADTVFKGVVTTAASRWVGEGNNHHIATFITFRVEETYKGAGTAEQTLEFMGGTVGDDALEIPDMPRFKVGQDAVLFVVNNGKQFCPLVGVTQGRFHVVKEAATGRERVFTDDFSPVVNTAEIGQFDERGVPRLRRYTHGAAQAMAAEDFRSEIVKKATAAAR